MQEAVLAQELVSLIGWRSVTMDVLQDVAESYAFHTSKSDCCKLFRSVNPWAKHMGSGVTSVLELSLIRKTREGRILQKTTSNLEKKLQDSEKKLEDSKKKLQDLENEMQLLVKDLESGVMRSEPIALFQMVKKLQLLSRDLENGAILSEPTEPSPSNKIERHRTRCERIVKLQMELAETYNNFTGLYEDTDLDSLDFEQRQVRYLKVRDPLRNLHLEILDDEDVFHGNAPWSSGNFSHRTIRNLSANESQQTWCEFLELMHESRLTQCSDSRDRIYGYYSLGVNLGISILLPDYSFPA